MRTTNGTTQNDKWFLFYTIFENDDLHMTIKNWLKFNV